MLLILLTSLVSCDNFAFLYAGSFTFVNYRHQADVFTIYNQLLDRGYKTSQIGLYAFDDIATHEQNPFQGQIFHSLDHKLNVYPGTSAITVKGGSVNARAFLNAVKKFPTTSEDRVFMYYSDHGGPNLLGTPNGDLVSAHNLLYALQEIEPKHIYKQILFIIEACYSGSVGKVIGVIPNMAIITAANNIESSYADVFDSEVGVYITDECTNHLVYYIDEKPEVTIGDLFEYIKEKTLKSHVCYFGDESIKSQPISDFIGKPTNAYFKNCNKNVNSQLATPKEATERTLSFLSTHSKAAIRAKARLEQLRLKALTEKFEAVLELLVQYVDPENYEKIMNDTMAEATPTYYSVVDIFVKRFGEINPDDLYRFNVLKALAATHTKAEIVQGIYAVVF